MQHAQRVARGHAGIHARLARRRRSVGDLVQQQTYQHVEKLRLAHRFDAANRHNAYNVYLQMEPEVLHP